jgi:hypothetical protein
MLPIIVKRAVLTFKVNSLFEPIAALNSIPDDDSREDRTIVELDHSKHIEIQ